MTPGLKAFGLSIILITSLLQGAAPALAESTPTPHGGYLASTELCGICHDNHESPAAGAQRERRPVRIENDDPEIIYNGRWAAATGGNRTAGTSAEASEAVSSASFTFTGDQITWLATKTPDSGQAKVYIDSAFTALIDLYDTTTSYQAPVFAKQGMVVGSHKIEIRVTRTKQPSSGGYTVDIDAFDLSVQKVMLLKNKDEKSVCYTCHNGTGSLTDIAREFGETSGTTAPVSKHPVPQGTVLCSDCHSPHARAENWDATAEPYEIVRLLRAGFSTFIGFITRSPDNWPAPIPANLKLGVPEQRRLSRPYAQCGGCHGTGSPLPGGDILKYYDYGGTKHDSTVSVSPDSKAEIACITCHDWHVSSLPKLLETKIAGNVITANDNKVCYACHIKPKIASYDATSGDVHGAADSTQAPGSPGLLGPYDYRIPQIRCVVCHSPHGTKNLYWTQTGINATDGITIDGTAAANRSQWEGYCAACHTYTHDSTATYDTCVNCHFHGAGNDSSSTTKF